MKLQHNVLSFIVVVVYNYRTAHFAEAFLYQLTEQIKTTLNLKDMGKMENMNKCHMYYCYQINYNKYTFLYNQMV